MCVSSELRYLWLELSFTLAGLIVVRKGLPASLGLGQLLLCLSPFCSESRNDELSSSCFSCPFVLQACAAEITLLCAVKPVCIMNILSY